MLELKAKIHDGSHRSDVVIANVSTGGLMGKSAHPPAKGVRVVICHGSTNIEGRIIWSRGRRFGFAADQAIDVETLIPPVKPARPKRIVNLFGPLPKTSSSNETFPTGQPQSRKRVGNRPRRPEKPSLATPIVTVLVAVLTTSAAEAGLLDFSLAWQTLRHFMH